MKENYFPGSFLNVLRMPSFQWFQGLAFHRDRYEYACMPTGATAEVARKMQLWPFLTDNT